MLRSGRIGEMFGTLMFGMFGVLGPALAVPHNTSPTSVTSKPRVCLDISGFLVLRF
jgi:hypothetical protein